MEFNTRKISFDIDHITRGGNEGIIETLDPLPHSTIIDDSFINPNYFQ